MRKGSNYRVKSGECGVMRARLSAATSALTFEYTGKGAYVHPIVVWEDALGSKRDPCNVRIRRTYPSISLGSALFVGAHHVRRRGS